MSCRKCAHATRANLGVAANSPFGILLQVTVWSEEAMGTGVSGVAGIRPLFVVTAEAKAGTITSYPGADTGNTGGAFSASFT